MNSYHYLVETLLAVWYRGDFLRLVGANLAHTSILAENRRLPERFHPALKSFHAFSEVSQDEIRALLGQCLQVDHHAHQVLGRLRRIVLQLGERDFKFVFNLVVGTLSHDVSSGRFRR
jgi:hypothetical protein